MLIGLCGPHCAGKHVVAEYLVTELGFTALDDPALLSRQVGHVEEADVDHDESKNGVPSLQLTSRCWRTNINIVIINVKPDALALPGLLKRPYFLLVYVDAPLIMRFQRAVAAGLLSNEELAKFVRDDDQLRYGRLRTQEILMGEANGSVSGETLHSAALHTGDERQGRYSLSTLERMSRLRVLNNFCSLSEFVQGLRTINFTDAERLRPSWDTYFMSLAKLASERTNCMKRRVGCVIARNKRMVATGYNGTPSGVKNCLEGGCGRCNGAGISQGVGLDLCLCLHAEENAIIEAGRERCEGSTLYTNLFPCILCSKKIVQSGISRLVFEKHYATDAAAEGLLRAGNVIVDAFGRDDVSRTLGELVLHGTKG